MKERIVFKNKNGINIVGVLSQKKYSNKAVIICHGFRSKDTKSGIKELAYQQILNKEGLSTFRFDFLGQGESEGDIAQITVSEAADEILRALNILQIRGHSRFGVIAKSFGGISALNAAAQSNNISVMALTSPVSEYENTKILVDSKNELTEWEKKGYM